MVEKPPFVFSNAMFWTDLRNLKKKHTHAHITVCATIILQYLSFLAAYDDISARSTSFLALVFMRDLTSQT